MHVKNFLLHVQYHACSLVYLLTFQAQEEHVHGVLTIAADIYAADGLPMNRMTMLKELMILKHRSKPNVPAPSPIEGLLKVTGWTNLLQNISIQILFLLSPQFKAIICNSHSFTALTSKEKQ